MRISLGAKKVCERAFEVTRAHDVRCRVVSDQEALAACLRFLHDHRLLVEPACGASLAAIYEHHTEWLAGFDAPLVVVCGGATATLGQVEAWQAAVEVA
jgi:L-serine/L-threonine ammonia-lyase